MFWVKKAHVQLPWGFLLPAHSPVISTEYSEFYHLTHRRQSLIVKGRYLRGNTKERFYVCASMCVHVHAWVSVHVCVEAHGCRCVWVSEVNSNPKDPAASASQGWAGSADTMFHNLGPDDQALSSHMHCKHATTKPSPQSPQRTFPKKTLHSFILRHLVLVCFEIMLITENCIVLDWACSNHPAGLQLRLH